MSAGLEVSDLVVRFGDLEILHGISLRVGRGETVAVVGRNGAGKTTLLRAVAGLVRPASGAIAFDGIDLVGLPAHRVVRTGISYVPETGSVFRELTVMENLLIGTIRLPGGDADRLEEVFALFPVLRGASRRIAGELSGGQQRMLGLARALMRGPRLIVLDEPSLGLAPEALDELFRTLKRLSARGTTVLLVEQLVHRALSIASRGYLLDQGRVVLAGRASSILDGHLAATYLGVQG